MRIINTELGQRDVEEERDQGGVVGAGYVGVASVTNYSLSCGRNFSLKQRKLMGMGTPPCT